MVTSGNLYPFSPDAIYLLSSGGYYYTSTVYYLCKKFCQIPDNNKNKIDWFIKLSIPELIFRFLIMFILAPLGANNEITLGRSDSWSIPHTKKGIFRKYVEDTVFIAPGVFSGVSSDVFSLQNPDDIINLPNSEIIDRAKVLKEYMISKSINIQTLSNITDVDFVLGDSPPTTIKFISTDQMKINLYTLCLLVNPISRKLIEIGVDNFINDSNKILSTFTN